MKPWRDITRNQKETGKGGVEETCKSKAKRRKYWVRKFKSPSNRSVPDDVFCRHGIVFWVEFKAPGKKPTENQDKEIAAIRAAGGVVYVIDSVPEFDKLLDKLDAQEFLL